VQASRSVIDGFTVGSHHPTMNERFRACLSVFQASAARHPFAALPRALVRVCAPPPPRGRAGLARTGLERLGQRGLIDLQADEVVGLALHGHKVRFRTKSTRRRILLI
jgi:hypothetical protein